MTSWSEANDAFRRLFGGTMPGRDFATGDDPVLCHLCGKDTSLAMIVHHLESEHGIDQEDIANAEIVDHTDPRDVGA